MTLLGKELRQALDRRSRDLAGEVRLLACEEDEIGTVTEIGGAATFVGRFGAEELEGVAAVFFCGEIDRERPLLTQVPAGTVSIVLSRGATAEDGEIAVAGIGSPAARRRMAWVSPHPAAVALAHLLAATAPLGLLEASVTVLQPASHHAQAGIDELFEETRGIVTFTAQPRPRVFGRQLAFNLLPSPGEGEQVQAAVAAALGPGTPPLHVQVVQGGMFHGLALSADLRFASAPAPRELARALVADPWIELAKNTAHLGPIDGSASEKIQVGELRAAHRGDGGQVWLWAVLDNLTVGGALNALALAEPWLA